MTTMTRMTRMTKQSRLNQAEQLRHRQRVTMNSVVVVDAIVERMTARSRTRMTMTMIQIETREMDEERRMDGGQRAAVSRARVVASE